MIRYRLVSNTRLNFVSVCVLNHVYRDHTGLMPESLWQSEGTRNSSPCENDGSCKRPFPKDLLRGVETVTNLSLKHLVSRTNQVTKQ